uniref:Transmembrane protein 107 n=1 Tax=Lygus hesperus TaxID=30085 RepID=A0A0A9YYQ3_LYGHE
MANTTSFSPDSLVPARFLTLLANLIILILALWSRDGNVTASLPVGFEEDEYYSKDKEITVGLSLGITAIAIELLGFFSGISMFRTSISLFSIFLHGLACLATSQWLLQSWHSSTYWLIFMVCSLLPATIEAVTIVGSFIGSSKEF